MLCVCMCVAADLPNSKLPLARDQPICTSWTSMFLLFTCFTGIFSITCRFHYIQVIQTPHLDYKEKNHTAVFDGERFSPSFQSRLCPCLRRTKLGHQPTGRQSSPSWATWRCIGLVTLWSAGHSYLRKQRRESHWRATQLYTQLTAARHHDMTDAHCTTHMGPDTPEYHQTPRPLPPEVAWETWPWNRPGRSVKPTDDPDWSTLAQQSRLKAWPMPQQQDFKIDIGIVGHKTELGFM